MHWHSIHWHLLSKTSFPGSVFFIIIRNLPNIGRCHIPRFRQRRSWCTHSHPRRRKFLPVNLTDPLWFNLRSFLVQHCIHSERSDLPEPWAKVEGKTTVDSGSFVILHVRYGLFNYNLMDLRENERIFRLGPDNRIHNVPFPLIRFISYVLKS